MVAAQNHQVQKIRRQGLEYRIAGEEKRAEGGDGG